VTAEWIDTAAAFADLVARVADEPRYALDTEFHRERTYYPKLALLQVAWPGGVALVDPLAVDVARFATVLDGPGVAVLHAAQQDFEVLQRSCGTVPSHLVDTQLLAGFAGYSTPSLMNLVAAELQVRLPKADRLTDWLRRPLTEDQKTYAASDVVHLLRLHELLATQLEAAGRLGWALEECELLRARPVGPGDPNDAWLRLKDVRTLKRQARGVARALVAWREARAARTDTPVRSILPDLAVLSVAQRAPRTQDELRACRGVEERHYRGSLGKEILAAVATGLAEPVDMPERDDEELDRHLRPAVTLVSAWVSQLAKQERLDTTLLATRADLVALLRGDESARLARGWRAEVLGEDIKRLVAGTAAIQFDGRGGLRLIDVR
jgi:ribonuclease D